MLVFVLHKSSVCFGSLPLAQLRTDDWSRKAGVGHSYTVAHTVQLILDTYFFDEPS